jgi:hypothetical protein
MVNNNWVRLKSGEKCKLGANFFICTHLFVMCEKMLIYKLYYSHKVYIVLVFYNTLATTS